MTGLCLDCQQLRTVLAMHGLVDRPTRPNCRVAISSSPCLKHRLGFWRNPPPNKEGVQPGEYLDVVFSLLSDVRCTWRW